MSIPMLFDTSAINIVLPATNLVLQPQAFSAWSGWNATVVDNQAVAPDGTLTASKITFADNGQISSNAFTSAGGTVDSIYVKQGTQGTKIKLVESVTWGGCSFDFSAPSGNFQALPGGWFRIWFSDPNTASHYVGIYGQNAGDNFEIWEARAIPLVPPVPPPPIWVPGQRPFAASSLANTPIPANPILVPTNWPYSTGSNYYASNPFAFDIPASNAPVVTMTTTNGGWGTPTGTVINVPMTSGFNNNGAPDQEGISILPDGTIWSWFGFVRQTDTTALLYTVGSTNIVTGDGFGTITPLHGAGVVALGSSCLLGSLVKEEFAAGEILHKLFFSSPQPYCNIGSPRSLSPPGVGGGDGNSYNGILMEGQIMAIPAGTTMPAGLSAAYGQKMFRALRDYGAICHDTSGSFNFYMATNYNASIGGNPTTTWTGTDYNTIITDTAILLPLMQKVGPVLDSHLFVTGASMAFAPQLLTNTFAGSAMHITRDSDSTGQDIAFTANAQSFLNTAAITSFCSGTVGRVSTYYDQLSPTLNFVSAGANAPIIYQSGAFKTINGQPALSFDGTSNYLKASGSSSTYPSSLSADVAISAVIQVADRAANYCIVGPDTVGGLELRIDQTTGFVRLLKNGGATIGVTLGATGAVPLSTPVIVEAFYVSDGSWSIWLNGIETATGVGTLVSVVQANVQIGAGPGGTELFKGLIGQVLICANVYVGGGVMQASGNPQYSVQQYLKNLWGIPSVTTTLNATIGAGQLLYSNNNLTVFNSYGFGAGTLGMVGKSTGKWYDEVMADASNGVDAIGISNSGSTSHIDWANNGQVSINGGATIATIATWATGSLLSRAVDLVNKKVWFRVGAGGWNNDVLANQNPATNTGGISIASLTTGPYYPGASMAAYASQFSVNFGAKPLTAVPSGFAPWQ